MSPSRLRDRPVPSQLPTAVTIDLTAGMAGRRRRTTAWRRRVAGRRKRNAARRKRLADQRKWMAGWRKRMAARLRRMSPTSCFVLWTAMNLLGWGMGVSLGILFVYIFVYKQAATLMNRASSDRYGEIDERDVQVTKKPEKSTHSPKQSGKCVLPAFPHHGVLVISNAPNATPGQTFEALELTVNCSAGYRALGAETVLCVNGKWSASIPNCIRYCKLNTNPSVRYRCRVSGSTQYRGCNAYEPSGTVVEPECNTPNYYSASILRYMTCDDGSWDNVADCSPECGRLTPNGMSLIADGRPAQRGELPWHVGIYRKTTRPYEQICGGTIITNNAVVTAAHCFWKGGKKQDPSLYAVAAGKIYRPWNNGRDKDAGAQMSDVKEIMIPDRFQGSAANFQDDVAVVIVEPAFKYRTYVRPICLDFNKDFERSQLQPGKLGKLAGWGLTAENGKASQVLKVVDLPYVDIERCITVLPLDFREYITSDKICAGFGNGSAAPCKGDSGGGLAFPEYERGTDRYYLRGIASTAATNEHECNIWTPTAFTQIHKHEDFIKESLFSLNTAANAANAIT